MAFPQFVLDAVDLRFLNYQTGEKEVASEVRELLATVGIKSFTAHDDIEVSEEWRHKILAEIDTKYVKAFPAT